MNGKELRMARPGIAQSIRACRGLLLAAALVSAVFFPLSGCTRDDETAERSSMRISIAHRADGEPLRFDTLAYADAAGNRYSVTRLRYYLSDFVFKDHGGEALLRLDSVFYVDARDSATLSRAITGIPAGHYHSLEFTFGLAPARNKTGALPATLENLNMAWPQPMGGGYHLMQKEGRLLDSTGKEAGYATHIGSGTIGGEIQENHWTAGPFMVHVEAGPGARLHIPLVMEVQEWYRTPNVYDLGGYPDGIVDDPEAQDQLRENGPQGVFDLERAALEALP
jgi:hypothetical protein